MGKQSARIYYKGLEHKEIYYQGHYHNAMYLGDQLVWEKLKEESGEKFEFKFTGYDHVSYPYDSYRAKIGIQGNVKIDWGDGIVTNELHNALTTCTHEYIDGGERVVRIIGNLENIRFGFDPDLREFYYTAGVIYTILPSTMKNTEYLDYMFYLSNFVFASQEIFENFFSNCTAAKSFKHCFDAMHYFYESYSINQIPERLFWNCPNAENFDCCFSEISEPIIPENLFKNNTKAVSFHACFAECFSDIFGGTLIIPEKLFWNCLEVIDFSYCFTNTLIRRIPEKLFWNCSKVITFKFCFGFGPNMPGYESKLETIPENLFKYNTKVKDFSHCFESNSGYHMPTRYPSILRVIPEHLFDNCSSALNFGNCFWGNRNLASIAKIWETHPEADGRGCYAYGYHEYNDNAVLESCPDDWKGDDSYPGEDDYIVDF